jgi:hypothetical protein
MTYMIARSARIGSVALAVMSLTAAFCGDAFAKVHERHLHARNSNYQSRAQLVPQQPTQPEPMRYYGGPKSPMWRGPVGN